MKRLLGVFVAIALAGAVFLSSDEVVSQQWSRQAKGHSVFVCDTLSAWNTARADTVYSPAGYKINSVSIYYSGSSDGNNVEQELAILVARTCRTQGNSPTSFAFGDTIMLAVRDAYGINSFDLPIQAEALVFKVVGGKGAGLWGEWDYCVWMLGTRAPGAGCDSVEFYPDSSNNIQAVSDTTVRYKKKIIRKTWTNP